MTWINAMAGTAWNSAGGDYGTAISTRRFISQQNGWEDYDVSAAVRNFHANPGSNYGFFLRSADTPLAFNRYYYSSESSTLSQGPKLTIEYSTDPPVFTSILVEPWPKTVVRPNEQKQMRATAYDQFGYPFASQPTFSWQVDGGGVIDEASGVFIAGPDLGGPFTITASANGIEGTTDLVISLLPDDFNDNSLGEQWTVVDADNWDGSSVAETGQQLVLTGRGADIWQGVNEFIGVWRDDVTGDFDVWVEIVSQTNTDSWAKSGIMAANNIANPSEGGYCFVGLTPGNGITFHYDLSGGIGEIESNVQGAAGASSCWVRLVKSGTLFTAWYSFDESPGNWIQIGQAQSPQQTAVNSQIALFCTSHNGGQTGVSVFDNFCTDGSVAMKCALGDILKEGSAIAVNRREGGISVLTTPGSESRVMVVDLKGRVVAYIAGTRSGICAIATESWSAGCYVIKVAAGSARHEQKVIIGR